MSLLFTGGALAQADTENEDEEEEEDTVIIDLSGVIDAIESLSEDIGEFFGNFTETVVEAITTALVAPFKELAQRLIEVLAAVLTTTPSVDSNPAVQDVHGDVLLVTYLLATLALMVAGILYITGPVLGVSYAEVRQTIPRILIALLFATVSLPLLQLAVDLTNALTAAFAPAQEAMSLGEIGGISVGLVLVAVLKGVLLLALVALFLIRDIYLIFVAAISPLIALLWSLPKTSKYADTFIGGWFAALLIAPLDMLVLKLSLSLMKGAGSTGLEQVSNWMFGVATLALLLLVPKMVWDTSQAAAGQARRLVWGTVGRHRQVQRYLGGTDDEEKSPRLPDARSTPRYRGPTPPARPRPHRSRNRPSSRIQTRDDRRAG